MRDGFRGAPKARTNNIVVSELKDELLLYCLETHKAYCLNKTAASVYQASDGSKSTLEIARALSEQFRSTVSEEFVSFTLRELREMNLLEHSDAGESVSNKQSRREVIRRIALSSAVALPVISMLVAPKAADAQSAGACGNDGGSCTGGSSSPPFTQGTCCTGLTCCPDGTCRNGFCPV